MTHRNRRTQRGSTLLLAIGLFTITTIFAVTLLSASMAGTWLSERRSADEAAFQVADGGASLALQALSENCAYTGQGSTALGTGTFVTVVTSIVGSPGNYQILSTGSITEGEGGVVTKQVRVVVSDVGTPAIGSYAIISKGPLSFGGNANVGSSPTPGIGNVMANSNVSLSGSVSIDGSVSAVGTISTSGHASATGGQTQGAAAVAFPTLNTAALIAQAQAEGITNGSVTGSGSQTVNVTGYINGDLTMTGQSRLAISGVVYVTGTVKLTGGSLVGPGTLISQGDVSITGNGALDTNQADNIALVALSTLKMSGGATVNGAVICPNGNMTMSGHSSVFGSVAADTITMVGAMTITRNTNYVWPPTLGVPKPVAWQEL